MAARMLGANAGSPVDVPSTQQASLLRQLQRTHGNGHVQALLGGAGSGYHVTAPGDAHERQAGQLADAVLGSRGSAAGAAMGVGAPVTVGRGSAVTPVVAAGIEALRGRGEPLAAASRDFFEPRFGRDLEQIRIHTGERAAGLAEMLNADAFAVGPDLVFARGQYAPDTYTGQHRLAHELAHSQQAALGGARAQAVVARDKDEKRAPKTGLAGTVAAPEGDGMTVDVPITADMATMDNDTVYYALSRSAARLLLESRAREPGEFELTLDRDNLRTIITRAGGWTTKWGAGNAASIVATALAAKQTSIPYYTTTDSFVGLVMAYREVAKQRKDEIERMLERIKNSTLPQDLMLDFYRGQINGAIKFGIGLTDLPVAPVNLGAAVFGSEHRFHTLDLIGMNVDSWQLDYASGYGKRYGGDMELGTQIGLGIMLNPAGVLGNASTATKLTVAGLAGMGAGEGLVRGGRAVGDLADGQVNGADGKRRDMTEDEKANKWMDIANGAAGAWSMGKLGWGGYKAFTNPSSRLGSGPGQLPPDPGLAPPPGPRVLPGPEILTQPPSLGGPNQPPSKSVVVPPLSGKPSTPKLVEPPSVNPATPSTISGGTIAKILDGEQVANPSSPGGMSTEIIGAHSPKIKNHPGFAYEVLSNNPDGTTTVKVTKGLPGNKLSQLKKTTLAPDSWSDTKILKAGLETGATEPIAIRASDKFSLHRAMIDGVEWYVIKDPAGSITSSFPSGGHPFKF